jgi:hypothetical protein
MFLRQNLLICSFQLILVSNPLHSASHLEVALPLEVAACSAERNCGPQNHDSSKSILSGSEGSRDGSELARRVPLPAQRGTVDIASAAAGAAADFGCHQSVLNQSGSLIVAESLN